MNARTSMLVLAAVLAVGWATSANASPIRFDNPPGDGHFVWDSGVRFDITSGPDSQTHTSEEYGPQTLYYSGVQGLFGQIGAEANAELQCEFGIPLLVGVGEGVEIPSSLDWDEPTDVEFLGESRLPEGTETYLGVRWDAGGGYQYGWIGIIRSGVFVDPFAWGYETEVGTPIAAGAVPEPATLSLLVLGGLGLIRRRR